MSPVAPIETVTWRRRAGSLGSHCPNALLGPEARRSEVEATAAAAHGVGRTRGDHRPLKLVAMSAKPLQRAKPFNNAVHVRDRRCLDIHVSPAAVTDVRTEEPRRGYYERRENEVPSNATRVQISDEWIRFALTEKIAQKRPPPPPAPKDLRGHEAENWQYFRRLPLEYLRTGTSRCRSSISKCTPRSSSTFRFWASYGHRRGSLGVNLLESFKNIGGEGGIRTLGRLLAYARLASGYLRPLGHLSRPHL